MTLINGIDFMAVKNIIGTEVSSVSIETYATRAALMTAHAAGPLADGTLWNIPGATGDGSDMSGTISNGVLDPDPICHPRGILSQYLGNDATWGWSQAQGSVIDSGDGRPCLVANGTGANTSILRINGAALVRPVDLWCYLRIQNSGVDGAIANTSYLFAGFMDNDGTINGAGFGANGDGTGASSRWWVGPAAWSGTSFPSSMGAGLFTATGVGGQVFVHAALRQNAGNSYPAMMVEGGDRDDNTKQVAYGTVTTAGTGYTAWTDKTQTPGICWAQAANSNNKIILEWIRVMQHPEEVA